MAGLAENLREIQQLREQNAARRKKRMQQLVSLVSTIPDPSSDPLEDGARMTPTVTATAGGKHSMGDGHGHSSAAEVKGLNAEFNKQLSALIKASGGKISIGSGYRSIAEQTKIYNLWKAGKHPAPRVAKPGSSNHNHGLAADLKFADKEARRWAHANAAKYGLVFPMGDEPWHIEPVNAKAKRKK